MVLLLTANNINHLVKIPVIVSAYGSSYVLRYINGSSVLAEQNLELVSAFLAFSYSFRNIYANRTVFCLKEQPLFKTFGNNFFSEQIGVAFIIELVKRYAGTVVSSPDSVKSPAVHCFPKLVNFGVTGFPFYEHFFRLFGSFGMSGFGLIFFAFQILVKFHIALTYKMVAFHSEFFRRIAVCFVEKLIGKHRLADMNTAVVYYVYLEHIGTGGFKNARNGFTERVVAQMTEMKRLVCIWA